MAKKYVCIADKCVWRVDCGPNKAICSRTDCPNIRVLKEALPPVKWGNIKKN